MKLKLPEIFTASREPASAARLTQAGWRGLLAYGATMLAAAAIAAPDVPRLWLTAAAAFVTAGIHRFIARRGHPRLANYILIGSLWVLALGLAVTGGGARAPAYQTVLVILAYSTWVLSPAANVALITAGLAAGLGLAVAENWGWLPESNLPTTGLYHWANLAPLVAGAIVFQLEAVRLMQTALTQARVQAAENRRLAMVASETTNAVVITDLERRIDWVNAGFTRLTGYTLEEARGQRPTFLHGPATDPAVPGRIQQALADGAGAVSVELVNYHKSGRPYWVHLDLQPLHDDSGRPAGYMAIESDITERKAAEAALRASDERSRSILEVLNEGVVLHDQTGAITFANASAERLLGLAPADRTVRPFQDPRWRAIGPDGAPFPAEAQPALVTLRTGQPQDGVVMGVHRPDGTLVWLSVNSRPILAEAGGGPTAVVASFTDITHRLAAEAAARRLQDDLERRVSERTAELQRANVALAQANRLKDEFLASISHELRTPLTGILGLTEALGGGVYGPLSDRQRLILQAVDESGRHLLALINDLLDYSHLEAGLLDLIPGPVAAMDVAQASLEHVGPLARAKQQVVQFAGVPCRPQLRADPRRLKQILVNLLGNAIKFTPAGGTLGLEVQLDAAGQIRFTVWDSGIGIAPENLPQLFQPFVQLDGGLARQYSGAGLGLALVKRLTDLHGGQVSVSSQLGHGSRFTVSLPWDGTLAGA